MANVIYEKKAINSETGEVLYSNQYQKIFFSNEKGYVFFTHKNSIRIFDDINLPDDITDDEIGKLFKLSKKTYKNTNMLMYRSKNNIKAMQIEHISKLLGVSLRRAQMFVHKMIKYHIMAKVLIKNSEKSYEVQYYLNPLYFFHSKYLNLNLYLLFKNDLDKYLPKWVIAKFCESGKNN